MQPGAAPSATCTTAPSSGSSRCRCGHGSPSAKAQDPQASAALAHVAEELAATLQELRELARGIHPAVLTDHGLVAAIEALAARAAVHVELRLADCDRLAPAVEATAYYIVAEALTNIAKYARAGSATVSRRADR